MSNQLIQVRQGFVNLLNQLSLLEDEKSAYQACVSFLRSEIAAQCVLIKFIDGLNVISDGEVSSESGSYDIIEKPVINAQGKIFAQLKIFGSQNKVEDIQTVEKTLGVLALLADRFYWKKQADVGKQKYENFVSHSSEGVFRFEGDTPMPVSLPLKTQIQILLRETYLVECNDEMARMYGYDSAQELIGKPLRELLVPEDPRNVDFIRNFIQSGYCIKNVESVERDRFGQFRYFCNSFVGVQENGCLIRGWGTQTDITDQKQLESHLTALAQQATAANQAKSLFLANMSHEIRTPLNVILGFADLILDEESLSEAAHKHVSAIKRNGQVLSRLLGEVLDLSKIEAQRLEVEKIRFPLVAMLEDTVSFMELAALEKKLSLILVKRSPLPSVIQSDPTRLRQILINLVSNAIKFTSKGGVILTVGMVGVPKVDEQVELEFQVIDSGEGIGEEWKDKLFEPFVQGQASTQRRFGGTGLGLTIAKQFAQAMGGDLELERSEVGRGSTFRFKIFAGPFDGNLVDEQTCSEKNSFPKTQLKSIVA